LTRDERKEVIEMERAHKSNAPVLLALLAAAFAVAAIWAATALAGGDSSLASSDPGSSQPASEFVQSQEEPAPSADDCPDHQDGSGGGSGGDSGSGSGDSSGTNGSSSTDF
jgi:hypothetical protein